MNSFEKKIETVESLMPDGYTYQVDSDLLAGERADWAALAGLWEKYARPGFEASAREIAQIAQIDKLHGDAFFEDWNREQYNKYSDEQEREEEERLFTEICANLEEQPFAAKYPLMVFEVGEFSIGTVAEGTLPESYKPFKKNAEYITRFLTDPDGNSYTSRALVLDQEAIDKFGIIGEVTIEQGFGSHQAHVYRLHRDSIVEHGYRTTEDDGLDEEGYEINTRCNSQYLGFLSVRQLQGLLNTLRNVDGFIDPDIALSDASRASLNARSDEVRRILDRAGDEQRDDRTYYQRYMEDLEEQKGYREDADQSGVDEWDDVEHMDLLAMERNEGPDGEAVDGYGNRIDADY